MSGALGALARAVAERADSWINAWTGQGTWRDKTTAGRFDPSARLTDPELSALYSGDSVARKVVSVIPRQMLRRGFTLASSNQDAATQITNRIKALQVQTTLEDGMIWARLYGGSVVFAGADDGMPAETPLREDLIRSVDFLQVYDRRYAIPHTWYTDPRSPKFRQPRVYQLTSEEGTVSYVHESRLVIFRGAHTDSQDRRNFQSWDYSVLQAPYDALRQFWANHKAAEHMMTDASQTVLTIKGLFGMIAAGDLQTLQTRAQFLDMSRSYLRSVLLDADAGEKVEKIQTAFTGVPDLLDRAANLLSACTEIPVTILMGQSPAGLNATGDVDLRTFYDRIETDRELILRPALERVVHLLRKADRIQDKVDLEFPSLWQETAGEKATREKTQAETDALYIDRDVISPEDVALARFCDKPRPIRIDPASRIEPQAYKPEEIPGATGNAADIVAPEQEVKVSPDFVMNGAQIASALEIVLTVSRGELPRDAAFGQLQVLFNLKPEQAEMMLASVGKGFQPRPTTDAAENSNAGGNGLGLGTGGGLGQGEGAGPGHGHGQGGLGLGGLDRDGFGPPPAYPTGGNVPPRVFVGQDVRIVLPHVPEHKTGRVVEVVGNAVALEINGQIHKWYLEHELAAV